MILAAGVFQHRLSLMRAWMSCPRPGISPPPDLSLLLVRSDRITPGCDWTFGCGRCGSSKPGPLPPRRAEQVTCGSTVPPSRLHSPCGWGTPWWSGAPGGNKCWKSVRSWSSAWVPPLRASATAIIRSHHHRRSAPPYLAVIPEPGGQPRRIAASWMSSAATEAWPRQHFLRLDHRWGSVVLGPTHQVPEDRVRLVALLVDLALGLGSRRCTRPPDRSHPVRAGGGPCVAVTGL